jgi:ABC-type multidrug transport system ATPase subunit/ABC-type uncharacterized transport system permease subunit
MAEFLEMIKVGFSDGLVWFPFVLGIGLLYKHLKIIDVSIDGAAIICGIACAWAWLITKSYTLSVIAALLSGAVAYTVMWGLITKLRVNPMLAGILFSLMVHALSVILIGESVVLTGTALFSSFLTFSPIPLAATVVAGASTEFYYRSNIGVSTRLVGSTPQANTKINPRLLTWLGFCVTGLVVGLGSAVYTHQQGVARAGGGFEFLVTGLSSFLLVDRLVELTSAMGTRARDRYAKAEGGRATYILYDVLHSVALKALVGSIFFQLVVLFIIAYTPNPAYWKLIFAVALLVSVAKPLGFRKRAAPPPQPKRETRDGVTLMELTVVYNLGYDSRTIFESLTASFASGINYVWGPNGSGKSTLLGCIRGDVPLKRGDILIDGKNVTALPAHERRTFLLTQNPYKTVAADLRVYENLVAAGQHRRAAMGVSSPGGILKEIEADLAKVRLAHLATDDNSFWFQEAGSLSGGQMQRVALYMALLSDAEVLLADEPSSGLDSESLNRLIAIFESFAAAGKTIIIATHDNRLAGMAGQHYEIINGRLLLRDSESKQGRCRASDTEEERVLQ